MHCTPYTQDTWVTRCALLSQQPRNANKSTNFRTIKHRQSNDQKKAREKNFRRVQHRPSAQGQEGPPRMGGGHADQEASSLDKGQHVALEERRSC